MRTLPTPEENIVAPLVDRKIQFRSLLSRKNPFFGAGVGRQVP